MAANSSSFAHATTGANNFSRKFGGINNSVDYFISGYFFIKFNYLPPNLTELVQLKYPGSFDNESQIANLLAASCQSVNIPGRTVNKTEHTGLGGITQSTPTNVSEDSNISLRFNEYQDMPIHKIFSSWTRLLRDNRAGASLLKSANGVPTRSNSRYRKSNYAGSMYYWLTVPNGADPIFASYYTGMFPMRDPRDAFSSDLAANDKVDIDMDFSFDYSFEEPWVLTQTLNFSNQYASAFGSTTNTDTGFITNGYQDL